jgi:hypothetical protein
MEDHILLIIINIERFYSSLSYMLAGNGTVYNELVLPLGRLNSAS